MTSLRKLPRTGTWEVGLIPVPGVQIRDEVLIGMLLVVEHSGLVRMAAPITDRAEIAETVEQAARAPVSGTKPGRPRKLVCTPELRFALRGVARGLGANLEVRDVLPGVEEAVNSLQDFLAIGISLVPEDPTPWRDVMADLLRERPWKALPDSVLFRFGPHESLEDAVAVVVGALGEQLGVLFYADEADYWLYLDQARSGEIDMEQLDFWCAHLDPVDEVPEAHVEIGREIGLVQDDLVLQLYAVRGRETCRLDSKEERSLLAAVQGILGAWRAHGRALASVGTSTRVCTFLGELEVRTTPDTEHLDLPEPLILEVAHQVVLHRALMDGEELPALTMKMAKRDAQRLARIIDGNYEVDAISMVEFEDHVDILAWEGPHEVGVLARIPRQAGVLDPWRAMGRGALFVSAGGAKRRSLRPEDVILALHVDLYDPTATAEPLFEAGSLEGASWEGPATSWPKASTVLLDFAAPLRVDQAPAQEAEQAIHVAAMVWSGVVLADQGGQPELRDRSTTHGGAAGLNG